MMSRPLLILLGGLAFASPVAAGSLDAPAGSAMYTLDDLYNRLNDGTAGAPRSGAFAEPAAGPGSTMHTLTEIMGKMPALDSMNGAGTADVLAGKTFWGLTGGSWGLRTGTAAAGANVVGADGQLVMTIPDGLYAGNKTATASDTDLTAGNIKFGVSIFGIAGNLIAASGDATPGEVLVGKTFSNASGAQTGTLPTQTLSATSVTVPAGYYAATALNAVDTDLASANIHAGVTIFGVSGDPNVVNTSSGDAVAADLAAGKKAWVDGAEITGTATAASPCICTGTLNGTRWCDNGDGTVTDLLGATVSGKVKGRCLVWLKNANCSATLAGINNPGYLNWLDAVIWSSAVTSSVCSLTDSSVEGDWRLPTLTELRVLTHGAEAVLAGQPRAFMGVQSYNYWSSTTDAPYPSYAWIANLYDGGVTVNGKTDYNYVWPVRGGL
ncbi:MAG: DUF1566 domain-containing protein [Candidatus Competibacteraceae bacterium]